jgi:ceramide glucosyltransferase
MYYPLTLFGIVRLSRYRGRQVPSRFANLPTSQVPGVTILRPLRGIDCNLAINLEASFLQDHPKIEIIFTVANEGDASIQVVESLIKKYPEIDAKLIIGELDSSEWISQSYSTDPRR